MNISEKLLTLHQENHTACQCELKKTATQPVFGIGNPSADVVFIGEAPGKKEDQLGEPFVGSSGKFLDEMLSTIKLKRSDVYITNTVKYRPPDNRDPSPLEKYQCYAWLAAELNFIKPKLIVTLGRHALNNFIPERKISEAHGKLLKNNVTLTLANKTKVTLSTHQFLALYHPAAALYNGGLRETLIEDFGEIPIILKKL